MTAIAVCFSPTTIALAADRRTTHGNAPMETCKITSLGYGGSWIASAGDGAAARALERTVRKALDEQTDVDTVRAISDAVHTARDKDANASAIVLTEGRALLVDASGVTIVLAEDWAIGCGSEICLGAIHASRRKSASARARLAVESACRYDVNCGGPIDVVEVVRG